MGQKRVAAYCRVSTEGNGQKTSIESQKQYFAEYIENNLNWEFAGLYADEGISGTNTTKRKEFNRMIEDARSGKIDLILTKEISRFARNTVDTLSYAQELKRLGIGIHFLTNNLNTLDNDKDILLTMMAAMAQEESRRTSERVRWGQKRQMEKGVVFGAFVYGYHLESGKLTVNEAEAKTVRLIYELCVTERMGTYRICNELANRGIPSPTGKQVWTNPTILRILKNEKYCGVLKQKKEITVDYLGHKRKINEGEEDYIVIENNHEPIVCSEMWHMAQKELANRKNVMLNKSNHSNRYVWSGKVDCELCGAKFKRVIQNSQRADRQIVWKCTKKIYEGGKKINNAGNEVGCDCKPVHESVLAEMFSSVMQNIINDKAKVVNQIKSTLAEVLAAPDETEKERNRLKNEIERLNTKKRNLRDLFTDGGITRAEFDMDNTSLNKQIAVLEAELEQFRQGEETKSKIEDTLENITAVVNRIFNFDEFSEGLCKTLLHKVSVKSREALTYFINADNNTNFFITLPIQRWE